MVWGAQVQANDGGVLHFADEGRVLRSLDLETIRAACGWRSVTVDDPYYEREMRFLACPLGAVLELGFQRPRAELEGRRFLLRALDGYTKPSTGRVLFSNGGHLAFADADLTDAKASPIEPHFARIDRRQLDPSPFYLVWTGLDAEDAHQRPWPYQLATIEVSSADVAFPRASPNGLEAGAAGWSGFELFVAECIACHALNGSGGRVGPDLNVPQSIVEYRPEAQIKAFIRDPETFRYSTMPAHRHLSDSQLDSLVAYFRAMSERKDDPAHRRELKETGEGHE